VSGAASYDIYRSGSGMNYVKVGSSTSTDYTDATAAPNTAYLYAVASVDGSGAASSLSGGDLATTVIFTDPTIVPAVTPIRTAHVAELRIAVNAVRALAGIGPFEFADPILAAGVTSCRAAHVTELRAALAAARGALSMTAAPYTDPTLTASATTIAAAHMMDLRSAMR
jgi:hypothetical protein